MLDAWCEGCDAVVLVFSRQVRSLETTEGGVTVRFRCWCGTEGIWHARQPVTKEVAV